MPDQTTPHPGAPQPPPNPFPNFPPPAQTSPLRVVVADDNPVVRAGLTALLSGRADITVVAEAADGREAYEAAHFHRPDVVLLDVRMPGVDGISALPYLVRIAPVVMLTYSSESEIVQEALRRGAGGYLVHGEFTADELVAAVRDIRQGRAHFTPSAAGRAAGPAAAGAGGAFAPVTARGAGHVRLSTRCSCKRNNPFNDPSQVEFCGSAFATATTCETVILGQVTVPTQREGGGDHGPHRVRHDEPADRRHLLHL